MTDTTRDAFEMWCKRRGGISTGRDTTPPANGGNGEYDNAWSNHAWWAWQAATLAAQRQPPEGYQLVPIEPTPEMLCILMQWEPDNGLSILPQYRAMLAAAPATPQGNP